MIQPAEQRAGDEMVEHFELEVVSGDEAGLRYRLPVNCYLVIARRASPNDATIEMTAGGDSRLEDDAVEIAERFIASRGGRGGSGHRLGLHTRVTDIELDDSSVSRTHAMVFHDSQGLSVVDLMSTNGTFVNGAPVADANLEPGDRLKVGEAKLRVLAQG